VRICNGKDSRGFDRPKQRGDRDGPAQAEGQSWQGTERPLEFVAVLQFTVRNCRMIQAAQNCLSCEHSHKMFVAEKLLIPKHGELPTVMGAISSSVEQTHGNTT
jgi:hypothetical protein